MDISLSRIEIQKAKTDSLYIIRSNFAMTR
jgi:hypothetical protein